MAELRRRPAAIAALGAVLAVAWVLVRNWAPVAAGHPSYLLYYVGLLAVAVATIAYGWRMREETVNLWLSIPLAVLLVVLGAVGIWLSPFAATETAVAALEDSDTVVVSSSASAITIEPRADGPRLGLVFYPGARVDARAYANVLRPIAEAGHQVVIVKEPLGIAFFATSFADRWVDDHPDIGAWIVGGHSLGGAVASSVPERQDAIGGLLLYASYPLADISDQGDLSVTSVYGLNDTIAEPGRIEASAADLPPDVVFAPIEGAIHSDFGDYGVQPGDGQPGITRAEAQEQIVEATLAMIGRLLES